MMVTDDLIAATAATGNVESTYIFAKAYNVPKAMLLHIGTFSYLYAPTGKMTPLLIETLRCVVAMMEEDEKAYA